METESAKEQVATDENGTSILEDTKLSVETTVSTELDETLDADVVPNTNGAAISSNSEPSTTPANVISVSASPVSNTAKEATTMVSQSTNTTFSTNNNIEEWVVMPESAWPPPIFMDKKASPNERFYLKHRWHSQWAYYDSKATESKKVYYRLQYIVVIGSLIIPALVSLNSTISQFITDIFSGDAAFLNTIRIGADVITVCISLAVAGAAAIESLKKYGENWNSYRSAAEELQAEKNYYDMKAGPYMNNANAFATFVDRVEGIVANQNGKYFQAVQKQLQKQETENEEIVASFKATDDDEYELTVSQTTSPVQTETEVAAG